MSTSKIHSLANRFELFNRHLIAFVEQCAAEDWRKATKAEDWPVGVTARHIGVGHYPLLAWVQMIVEGKPLPEITIAMINQANEQHAHDHTDCTHAEVVDILRGNGDKALAYLLTLGDEDINRQGYIKVFDTTISAGQLFALVLIDYANDHFESMKAALQGESSAASPALFDLV